MRKQLFTLLAVFALFLAMLPSAVFATTELGPSVRVDTVPGETFNTIVEQRAERAWTWYVTRASGLVAAVSLVALLISGIGSVTGHFFRILEPLTTWATHRALGIVFGASILLHMLTLLFDHFVPFSLAELLIPWASNYKPLLLWGYNLGSVFIALGVIAFYALVILVVTSWLWVDKKPRRWKTYHYLSYFIVFAVFIHGLFLGTDTSTGIGRILWYIGASLVAVAIIIRLRRVGSI